MEAICSSETFVHIYQITLRHHILCAYSSEILVHHQHELHAPGVLMMLADV